MEPFAPANEEAIEAWNTILFDKFLQFRTIAVEGLGRHGEAAFAVCPPPVGARALDLGCGFGDSTLRIAEQVGTDGSVIGVDAAARFIELARTEAADRPNVSYAVGDVQTFKLDGPFDYVFSRFCTMFISFVVPALRNVHAQMTPGGKLCLVVWRKKADNEWLHRAERVVEQFVQAPEETDEVTCGPGPFAQADANVVSDQLTHAGFSEITLRRNDMDIQIGRDLDDAVQFATTVGPAGEVLRLAGDAADQVRPQLEASLRDAMSSFVREDGVWAPSSTWIVTATAHK